MTIGKSTELDTKRGIGPPPWWIWAILLVAGAALLFVVVRSAGNEPARIDDVIGVVLAAADVVFISTVALIVNRRRIRQTKLRHTSPHEK